MTQGSCTPAAATTPGSKDATNPIRTENTEQGKTQLSQGKSHGTHPRDSVYLKGIYRMVKVYNTKQALSRDNSGERNRRSPEKSGCLRGAKSSVAAAQEKARLACEL